ncbi:MAG: hypothetical protein ACUVXD_00740 [Thermodesulfobacteriota bacterium]
MKTELHTTDEGAGEDYSRPMVEIWPDPYYDEWAEWVRTHERHESGNPVDLCEIALGMRASPLCPIGSH